MISGEGAGTKVVVEAMGIELMGFRVLSAPEAGGWPAQWMTTEVWLVGVTVLLAVATLLLYVATQRLVSGAERNAKLQLRAYIILEDTDLIWPTDLSADVQIVLMFKNCGQTPALNCRWSYGSSVGKEFDVAAQTEQKLANPASAPLGAGAKYYPRFNCGFPQAPAQWRPQVFPPTSTSLFLWVAGTVHYDDVFGQPHATDFRLKARTMPEGSFGLGAELTGNGVT